MYSQFLVVNWFCLQSILARSQVEDMGNPQEPETRGEIFDSLPKGTKSRIIIGSYVPGTGASTARKHCRDKSRKVNCIDPLAHGRSASFALLTFSYSSRRSILARKEDLKLGEIWVEL